MLSRVWYTGLVIGVVLSGSQLYYLTASGDGSTYKYLYSLVVLLFASTEIGITLSKINDKENI